MTELIQQTGTILTKAQELLKLSGVKEIVKGLNPRGMGGMETLTA